MISGLQRVTEPQDRKDVNENKKQGFAEKTRESKSKEQNRIVKQLHNCSSEESIYDVATLSY